MIEEKADINKAVNKKIKKRNFFKVPNWNLEQ